MKDILLAIGVTILMIISYFAGWIKGSTYGFYEGVRRERVADFVDVVAYPVGGYEVWADSILRENLCK